jgi:hypothetical protein
LCLNVIIRDREREHRMLAEEARLLAFAGAPDDAEWLDEGQVIGLLDASPDANVASEQAHRFLEKVLDGFDHLRSRLEDEARNRAAALLEAHRRVREGARMTGVHYEVEPRFPVDILGVYVYLPVA